MKRILLVALSIAVAGTLVTAQALEDTVVPDCDHCETVDCECDDCTGCEEECTCDNECGDCSCDDCSSEEEDEVIQHCGGGCH